MKKDVLDKLITLITVAFGLVAALAWNGAIKAIFLKVFGTAEGIVSMLAYAVIVTIIAVGVTVKLGNLKSKEDEKK